MTKKVCCVFIIYGVYKEKYHFFNENSVNSFKKWHPDVDVFVVEDEYPDEPYVVKYIKSHKKFFEKGYTKVIALNADTITCSRLDEFMDDDTTPILATLDFPMNPAGYKGGDVKVFQLPHNNIECLNVNAGVACFNSESALETMLAKHKSFPHEQAIMQSMLVDKPDMIKVVDFPYLVSPFVYNVRGQGVVGTGCIQSDGSVRFGFDGPKIGAFSPVYAYRPIGDKLYNHLGKHVKCFHFATRDPNLKKWFNDETVRFFTEHCACDWTLENDLD